MSNKKKGELSIAWIIGLIVSAFVTNYVKYPVGSFNFAEFLGIQSDFTANAIPIIAGIVSGIITYLVFSRWIKIDER